MSPSVREINGSRPSPLKIHKDSHQIQKPTTATVANAGHQQRQQPIIIYTHSPKVIHTQARDFMALVQKLTGLSRAPKLDENNNNNNNHNEDDDNDNNSIDSSSNNNNRSELKPKLSPPPPVKAAREQQQGLQSGYGDMTNPSAAAAAATIFGFDCPAFGISEIPMLTPNAADHIFCSPNSKSLYRYSPSAEAKVLPEF